MSERILLEVHVDAVKRWADLPRASYAPIARALLARLEKARREYDRTVSVEGDFWEPEWNPRKATFSWETICAQINTADAIDISGAQTGLCVHKVKEELEKRGFRVNVRADLTIDLDELR